jgi:hypothetical protein
MGVRLGLLGGADAFELAPEHRLGGPAGSGADADLDPTPDEGCDRRLRDRLRLLRQELAQGLVGVDGCPLVVVLPRGTRAVWLSPALNQDASSRQQN